MPRSPHHQSLRYSGIARAPLVSYGGSPFSWLFNAAISAAVPSNSGGAIASVAVVAGALPAGLALGSDGQITGTPSAEQYAGSATVRFTGPDGTSDAAISFDIPRAPSISFAGTPFAWVKDIPLTPVSVTSSAGQVTGYTVVAGSLAAGLSLNPSTGQISGTPTELVVAGTVTIRATGPGGTSDAVVLYVVAAL